MSNVKTPAAPKGETEIVKARVTKWGEGMISTGDHVSGVGDEFYPVGAIVEMPRVTAETLENRRLVEIQ